MEALLAEVQKNLEIASNTKKMLNRERDMLQGDVEERMILHQYHTDAWDATVNAGTLEELEDGDTLCECYMHLKECNEIVDWFTRYGNRIVHLPLLKGNLDGYGRSKAVDIIREKSDEAEILLRDARQQLEAVDL